MYATNYDSCHNTLCNNRMCAAAQVVPAMDSMIAEVSRLAAKYADVAML